MKICNIQQMLQEADVEVNRVGGEIIYYRKT